jgi:ketosteroid isomerase-like protein
MDENATWRDAEVVAELDRRFQLAVKHNDWKAMDEILADDHVLVLGDGRVETKADALRDAMAGTAAYERQDESEKTVRVWGDTAVVTAKLWIKGVRAGRPVEYRLWYSDTYVRGPGGWRYCLGQASLPLPPED